MSSSSRKNKREKAASPQTITVAEHERLATLADTLRDTTQAVTLAMATGLDARVDNPIAVATNRAAIELSLGRLAAALELMLLSGDVEDRNIAQAAQDHKTVLRLKTKHQTKKF